jgi:hypothetical protein
MLLPAMSRVVISRSVAGKTLPEGKWIMADKISAELAKRMRELQSTGSSDSIPVIVTLKSGVDNRVVEAAGLKIDNVLESVPAVSGSASASLVNRIAELDGVSVIEFDGETRAI